MITPMLKYSFIIYHNDYKSFLKKLREKGVVHIVQREQELDDELSEKLELISKIKDTASFLDSLEPSESKKNKQADTNEILEEIQTLRDRIEHLENEIIVWQKDYDRIAPWGDFSHKTLEGLKNNNIVVKFYMLHENRFEEIAQTQTVFEVNRVGTDVYFMLIDIENASKIEAEEVELNETPEEITNKIADAKKEIENCYIELKSYTEYIDFLKEEAINIQKGIDFDKATKSGTAEVEEKVIILEGWVPKPDSEALNQMLDEEKILHINHKPQLEEKVPIKLKNNWFTRLFESIGELYTLPSYKEIDLTPFFAPFYMLFFGFCLGDAGYGLLITLGTIYGLTKVKPKFKPILKLGMFLGIATTIMGIVSGTFFGIMLLDQSWPWLSGLKKIMMDNDQLMMFALALGYVQVVFGMFIKAANKGKIYGFKYSISQYGWIVIVLVSIPALALGNQGIISAELGNRIAIVSAIIGAIPAFFYNSPGKNPFLNFGMGLWDSYQTASGLLGDVLSYIRLFALGISSAILGNVFNTLAMELSPDTIILRQIVMVLILAFGHSLNFFMAALGSFVHPLRLTFVEFYKNAGFNGGGDKYEPFNNKLKTK